VNTNFWSEFWNRIALLLPEVLSLAGWFCRVISPPLERGFHHLF
jgi:hypothetical protein